MDEIPEGLEDLLNSIRGEGKPQQSSALAVIPNVEKQETDLVDDEIDERILSLLGLENITDIDYATYKTLLREKMMEGRMTGTEMSTEEVELLTNEFKRVKSATGRFKVKKKKINVGSFFETAQEKAETTTAEVEPAGALVKDPLRDLQNPEIVEDLEEQQEKDDKSDQFIRNVLAPSLNKIEDNLQSILDTVTKQFKFDKKESEKAADAAQTKKKKTREKEREAKVKGSGIKDVAKKVVKPVKGLFDMILDFFKNILLGGALLWLVNFLQNPAKAIQPFIDVLDNIIKFVNSVIKTIFDFIFAPINAAISSIWDGLGGLEDTLNNLLSMIPRFPGQDPFEPLDNINEENKPKFEAPQFRTDEEGNYIPLPNPFGDPEANQPLIPPATTTPTSTPTSTTEAPVQGQTQGGMVLNVNDMAFTQGGPIKEDSGVNITGMGKDTQLIAAQPGEVMMSRPAVQMIGAENLLAANAAAGSSNKPKMGSIMGYNNGGFIFDPKDPLGSFQRMNQEFSKPLPGTQPSVMFPGASPLLQSPATQMFQPQSPVIPSGPKRISGANYDVILPLDHTKKPGTIPDTPGGSTFKNSNATGADGREREHQDKAATIIGQKLSAMGLRVKIMTPEEYPSYQDYDQALINFASKGIKIVPLHFDAKGSVGFMTRTRAGDAEDARLASPIQQALVNFQRANPDLGSIGSDTDANATIDRAALSPAALVELGVMVDWEKKYGKDFTSTSKFDELATSVSAAIFQGGGFGTPPVSGTVQTAPLVSPTERSSTMSSSPQALQAPAMRVSPTTGLLIPPGPPGQRQTNVIMAGVGGQQRLNSGPTSAAMASQKRLPAISPIDGGNNEMIVIKSIYNIVG